mmetsp:Transcript_77030/g.146576  ORF Transcript_77030/g.146576 Transcript_77030/m.146576 type:complete len:97 (-) Transcript_77030:153-443(-)
MAALKLTTLRSGPYLSHDGMAVLPLKMAALKLNASQDGRSRSLNRCSGEGLIFEWMYVQHVCDFPLLATRWTPLKPFLYQCMHACHTAPKSLYGVR